MAGIAGGEPSEQPGLALWIIVSLLVGLLVARAVHRWCMKHYASECCSRRENDAPEERAGLVQADDALHSLTVNADAQDR